MRPHHPQGYGLYQGPHALSPSPSLAGYPASAPAVDEYDPRSSWAWAPAPGVGGVVQDGQGLGIHAGPPIEMPPAMHGLQHMPQQAAMLGGAVGAMVPPFPGHRDQMQSGGESVPPPFRHAAGAASNSGYPQQGTAYGTQQMAGYPPAGMAAALGYGPGQHGFRQGQEPVADQAGGLVMSAQGRAAEFTRGYVFRCNQGTLQECMGRGLFGATAREWEKIQTVRGDTAIFLYNTDTKVVHGVYYPLEVGFNLEFQAWGGRFPAQVRVGVAFDAPPMGRGEYMSCLKYRDEGHKGRKGWFSSELDQQEVVNVLGRFRLQSRFGYSY